VTRVFRGAHKVLQSKEKMNNIKNKIIFISSVWIIIITSSFIWNYSNTQKWKTDNMLSTGKAFFQNIVLTRAWNAQHGGVYVPMTKETQPNPYLKVPNREINVSDSLTLTKINPAFMTRQLSELAKKHEGFYFHITSLNPIRPANKATPWEADALERFEEGTKEVYTYSDKQFTYMAPLMTKQSCLKCHAAQGYKVGDIRGGISVSIPYTPGKFLFTLAIAHFLIAFAGIIFIVSDGRYLNIVYEKLRYQSIMDALTGIANRRYFIDTIQTEYQRSQRDNYPLSFIICDIDKFKTYNDTYGHLEGDKCLKLVAQTIKGTLKRPGDMVARYGGEEFVVILPHSGLDGALLIAEQMRSAIEALQIPHNSSSMSQFLTISCGVATSNGTISTYEELIKKADDALYHAKDLGRNRVEYI